MHLACRFRPLAMLAFFLVAPALAVGSPASHETNGQRREDLLSWTRAQRQTRFAHMSRIFDSLRVAQGAHVHPLPAGRPLEPRWTDGTTLESYMQANGVVGVMVLQDGRVRLQHYAHGFGPAQRWTSFSVAKSFTSLLLGVAMQRGDIRSLSDPLDRYIPELHGTAYADVTVRQLLTMTSGVRWNENYSDPHSDVAQMYRGACHGHEPHALTYLSKLPRARPAGTHWHYNTGETDLLGVLVQRATHRTLAALLSQAIWRPYGMAADAAWLTDACSGTNTGGSGLSATLADYARLGQFVLDGGRVDGRQVVARHWLDEALRTQQGIGAPGRGYGYQWWTYDDGSYAAIGIFGQLVYVDPRHHMVIVQLANWPHALSDKLVAARHAFVEAVERAADQ